MTGIKFVVSVNIFLHFQFNSFHFYFLKNYLIKIRELEILKPDQIKDIFVNIEDIVKVSEELTEQLRFRIVGWEESYGLSDIFEKSVNTILTFNNQIPYRFNILNMISQHTFTFLSFFHL